MNGPIDPVYWKVLVVRCQLGDQAAMEELIANCQPKLRGYLAKLLGSPQEAEDLTQDVWLDVFRDLPKLSKPGSFVPWLYRIARNRAFRTFRSRKPIASSSEVDYVADEIEEADDFGPDDARRVHEALEKISAIHREILLLRFLENMSYEDIAAVTDCEIGTVKFRLHHAKRLLRQILEQDEQP